MKSLLICLFGIFLTISIQGQITIDFESFNLSEDQFINNPSDGVFSIEDIELPNNYDPMWDSWSDWAISSYTDTSTPGFGNQYSVISGSGNENSTTYGLAYAAPQTSIHFSNQNEIYRFDGMYINNSTYAALSILNGDSFSKKFGGESGNDPDYYSISIKGFKDGQLSTDSILFYLADYRFEDNNMDYIINEWTYLDLSSLGDQESLIFTVHSSDIGAFGINTPTYFCVDDIQYSTISSTTEIDHAFTIAYPNPTHDFIHFSKKCSARLVDLAGNLVCTKTNKQTQMDVSNVKPGMYLLRINEAITQKIIIQ